MKYFAMHSESHSNGGTDVTHFVIRATQFMRVAEWDKGLGMDSPYIGESLAEARKRARLEANRSQEWGRNVTYIPDIYTPWCF